MMNNIILQESQYNRLFETNYNYHISKFPIKDLHPYGSENLIYGIHDTGAFGSGFYFSTFKYGSNGNGEDSGFRKNYGAEYSDNPNFSNMSQNIYRVDFDIYNNLYKIYGKSQGYMLHTMLMNLNIFFNRVTGHHMGNYNKENIIPEIRPIYMIISNNAKTLGLNCPKPNELYRLALQHKESNQNQTFATFFMESNGYNGVDVSDVPELDNTTHGSVIYDLSKTDAPLKPTEFKGSETSDINGPNTSVSMNGHGQSNNALMNVIQGKKAQSVYIGMLKPEDELVYAKTLIQTKDIDEYDIQDLIRYKKWTALTFLLKYMFNKRPKFDNVIFNQDVVNTILKLGLTYYKRYSNDDEWYELIDNGIEQYSEPLPWKEYDYDIPNDVLQKCFDEIDNKRELLRQQWQ